MSVPNFEFDTIKFNNEINILCENGFTSLEAIIEWCEKNSIEMESIVPFIKKNDVLKARLMLDADSLNMLKKPSKISIRKGGNNKDISQIQTRPAPPASMYPNPEVIQKTKDTTSEILNSAEI